MALTELPGAGRELVLSPTQSVGAEPGGCPSRRPGAARYTKGERGEILRPELRVPAPRRRMAPRSKASSPHRGCPPRRRARSGPCCPEYLHRDSGRGRGQCAIRPARAPRETPPPASGHRMLRAARARGGRRAPRRGMGVGNSHTYADRATGLRRPVPTATSTVGDIFAAGDFLSAPVEDARGERTRRQSQDSGRLQQPLLFLHHPVRAPGAAAACRRQAWWSRCADWRRATRNRIERHQPGPLGARAGQPPAAGGPGAAAAARDARGAPAPQLHRTDGLERRPAGPRGRRAARGAARSRAACKPGQTASCG